jgi:hypothetical protein
MTDRPDSRRLWLTTPDGKPVDLPDPDPVAAAFAKAMNEGPLEPSPPIAMWWSLSRPDGGGIHMRLTLEDRMKITDVYVHGRELTASDLQAVPLTELDLTVNLTNAWDGMDPWTVAEAYNEMAAELGWGQAVLVVDPGNGEDDPSLSQLRSLAANAPNSLHAPPAIERQRLIRPDGTDPDGFYALVAAAYREYAPHTRAPSVKIAEEAGVPVGTARGWVREARRRGKLPQGRKGKAG